jgi:catechol 2,3-dioxygenase-like lactoylglutathione lyase family enzyme
VARGFYCDTLGLRLVQQNPVALVVAAGRVTLRLTEVRELRPQPFTIAGWLVDNVWSTVVDLTSAGISMQRYEGMAQDEQGVWTAPGGDRVAWFADPDGNILSLTTTAT